MKVYFGIIGISLIFLMSCQKSPCSDSVKAKFLDATGLDGCGMIIELPDGKLIEPKNLSDFNIDPQDGQKIWVSYHLAQNGGTVCMIGDGIEIDCIAER